LVAFHDRMFLLGRGFCAGIGTSATTPWTLHLPPPTVGLMPITRSAPLAAQTR
jgi:hypothetical protein